MLVRRDAAGVRLFTRNGHDWTATAAEPSAPGAGTI
jgi:ATP-dependent DNA ligase